MVQEIKFINNSNTSLNEDFNRYDPIMGNDYILIDWMMGNTCNYSCSYCHPTVYDGSLPWPEVETGIKFVKRATDHYRSIGKNKIVWNLLGGEPTVWKDFSKFFTAVKEYDPGCIVRILTNGSRTLGWWERNKHLFDELIISFHPEKADYKHCTEVANILADAGVLVSIQVCMYPPMAEYCVEAMKYFHEHCRASGIMAKSLQETLIDDRTMLYEDEFLKEMRKYDGEPKKLRTADPRLTYELNKKKQSRPAYGKMMRFVNTYTGKTEFIQANDTMSSGRNSWRGWMCNIGIETLKVDEQGKVSSGSSCFTNLKHGTIQDPDNIEFPTAGRICEYDWCSCVADVEVTKYKI